MMSGVRASSIRIEVDLVDDGEDMAALDHVLQPVFHVVAQVVEAELVVGAVGDVAGIGRAALVVFQAVHDHADGEPEEAVDLPHPFGVASGEVVVDGDDVHAFAGERVEIDRQRGDQRLAFAGLHLGDTAFVQNHAADQLHIEMALAEGALGGLAHGGEGGNQNVVERGAVGDLFFEFVGTRAQFVVGKLLDFRFQSIDGIDARLIAADAPVVGGTEQLAGDRADHRELLTFWAGPLLPRRRGRILLPALRKYGTFRAIRYERGARRSITGRDEREIGGGRIIVNWRLPRGLTGAVTRSLGRSRATPLQSHGCWVTRRPAPPKERSTLFLRTAP